MIYILDVSFHRDPKKVPWAVLWDLGFRLVIIKASMGGGIDRRCDGHVELAKEHGFDIGLYHWVDPTQSWSGQYVHFRGQIYKHEPEVLGFDCEQWWADWAKWYKSIRGELPNDQVPRNSAKAMIESLRSVRERSIVEFKEDIPAKRQWTYIAKWVTDMFYGLSQSMEDHQLWVADYSLSRTICNIVFNGNRRLSAAEWNEWSRQLSDELFDYDGVPLLPDGHTDFAAWQVDSKVIPPGIWRGYDISLFKGGEEDYEKLMDRWDVLPPPPPPPVPQVRITYTGGVNVTTERI